MVISAPDVWGWGRGRGAVRGWGWKLCSPYHLIESCTPKCLGFLGGSFVFTHVWTCKYCSSPACICPASVMHWHIKCNVILFMCAHTGTLTSPVSTCPASVVHWHIECNVILFMCAHTGTLTSPVSTCPASVVH